MPRFPCDVVAMRIAPRISLRLLRALERIDDPTVSIAETCRRLGAEADRLGIPRPSYQRIRVLVHEHRRLNARTTSLTNIAMDVALRRHPPEALLDRAAGIPVPKK